MSKFALYKYKTSNAGDEIQSLAARQFLPHVNRYIDRDKIKNFKAHDRYFLIANGWYMHVWTTFLLTRSVLKVIHLLPYKVRSRFAKKIRNIESGFKTMWPPPENVEPLLISMHVSQGFFNSGILFEKKSIDYLKKWGPVGCRDIHTLKSFKDRGIPAYFSGCLTLTFPEFKGERNDKIYFVDVAESELILSTIPKEIELKKRTHKLSTVQCLYSSKKRFRLAESLLSDYRQAALVITSRLHVALPCLAFGTPVMFISPHMDDARFSGLIEHFNFYTPEEFCSTIEKSDFSWSAPKPNPNTHLEIRNQLIEKCQQWISDKSKT